MAACAVCACPGANEKPVRHAPLLPGPFPSHKMMLWREAGLLPMTLPVRCGPDGKFAPLMYVEAAAKARSQPTARQVPSEIAQACALVSQAPQRLLHRAMATMPFLGATRLPEHPAPQPGIFVLASRVWMSLFRDNCVWFVTGPATDSGGGAHRAGAEAASAGPAYAVGTTALADAARNASGFVCTWRLWRRTAHLDWSPSKRTGARAAPRRTPAALTPGHCFCFPKVAMLRSVPAGAILIPLWAAVGADSV